MSRSRWHSWSINAVFPLPTGSADADSEGALGEIAVERRVAVVEMAGMVEVFVSVAVSPCE